MHCWLRAAFSLSVQAVEHFSLNEGFVCFFTQVRLQAVNSKFPSKAGTLQGSKDPAGSRFSFPPM